MRPLRQGTAMRQLRHIFYKRFNLRTQVLGFSFFKQAAFQKEDAQQCQVKQ